MSKFSLILPKNGLVLDLKQWEHLYFLAGPIRWAWDWQTKTIKMLSKKDTNCYIACPCRYDDKHELFNYSLPATKLSNGDFELQFENQTMWERYYLEMASNFGSIIFWLPSQDKENPRKKEDGPYAQDTYGELGRWSIRSAYKLNPYEVGRHVNLVVGAEAEFPGLKTIQKNFNDDHKSEYVIYSSLEETIDQAIAMANII